MKSALLPAILLFGICAVGLVVVRDHLAGGAMHADEPTPQLAASVAPQGDAAPLPQPGSRQAVLRKEANGHFWAKAEVNGAPIRMLVDTGASVVVLTASDAREAGLNPAKLEKTAVANTANGRVAAAPATLKRIVIDGVEARDVPAMVLDEGLEHSLLGMSFLSRLSGWQVTPGAMVIRQ